MNRYFYIDNGGKQKGTFSPEELKLENIQRETLVWTQGMTDWSRAEQVEELKSLFTGPIYTDNQQAPPPTEIYHTQSYYNPAANVERPKSYMVESLLVTLLPFFICGSFLSLLGIIAIVYASQVDSYVHLNKLEEARESSAKARRWYKITFWVSIGWVIVLILGVLGIIALAGIGSFADIASEASSITF